MNNLLTRYKLRQFFQNTYHSKMTIILFQTLCSDQELKIISQSEKKNSMPISTGKYRFHAVDLSKSQSAHLIPCYRQLTKVNVFTLECDFIIF